MRRHFQQHVCCLLGWVCISRHLETMVEVLLLSVFVVFVVFILLWGVSNMEVVDELWSSCSYSRFEGLGE